MTVKHVQCRYKTEQANQNFLLSVKIIGKGLKSQTFLEGETSPQWKRNGHLEYYMKSSVRPHLLNAHSRSTTKLCSSTTLFTEDFDTCTYSVL